MLPILIVCIHSSLSFWRSLNSCSSLFASLMASIALWAKLFIYLSSSSSFYSSVRVCFLDSGFEGFFCVSLPSFAFFFAGFSANDFFFRAGLASGISTSFSSDSAFSFFSEDSAASSESSDFSFFSDLSSFFDSDSDSSFESVFSSAFCSVSASASSLSLCAESSLSLVSSSAFEVDYTKLIGL